MAPVEDASVEEEIHIKDDEEVEPLRMAKDPKMSVVRAIATHPAGSQTILPLGVKSWSWVE